MIRTCYMLITSALIFLVVFYNKFVRNEIMSIKLNALPQTSTNCMSKHSKWTIFFKANTSLSEVHHPERTWNYMLRVSCTMNIDLCSIKINDTSIWHWLQVKNDIRWTLQDMCPLNHLQRLMQIKADHVNWTNSAFRF